MGNKVRKLEFTLGEALAQGAESVVTLGAPQSNHARATAAAAARLGLHAVLVMGGERPAGPPSGNLLLDALFGAEVIFAGTEEWAQLAERGEGRCRAARGRLHAARGRLLAGGGAGVRRGLLRAAGAARRNGPEAAGGLPRLDFGRDARGPHGRSCARPPAAPRPVGFDVGQIVPDAARPGRLARERGRRTVGRRCRSHRRGRPARSLAARRRLRRVHAGRHRSDRAARPDRGRRSWTLSTAPREWRAWWRMPGQAGSRARSCSGTRAAARRCSRRAGASGCSRPPDAGGPASQSRLSMISFARHHCSGGITR